MKIMNYKQKKSNTSQKETLNNLVQLTQQFIEKEELLDFVKQDLIAALIYTHYILHNTQLGESIKSCIKHLTS